jgi:hypothetical protein
MENEVKTTTYGKQSADSYGEQNISCNELEVILYLMVTSIGSSKIVKFRAVASR